MVRTRELLGCLLIRSFRIDSVLPTWRLPFTISGFRCESAFQARRNASTFLFRYMFYTPLYRNTDIMHILWANVKYICTKNEGIISDFAQKMRESNLAGFKGVHQAKEKGKYKGRKPISIDSQLLQKVRYEFSNHNITEKPHCWHLQRDLIMGRW